MSADYTDYSVTVMCVIVRFTVNIEIHHNPQLDCPSVQKSDILHHITEVKKVFHILCLIQKLNVMAINKTCL